MKKKNKMSSRYISTDKNGDLYETDKAMNQGPYIKCPMSFNHRKKVLFCNLNCAWCSFKNEATVVQVCCKDTFMGFFKE
jgi:hypothetical protein